MKAFENVGKELVEQGQDIDVYVVRNAYFLI